MSVRLIDICEPLFAYICRQNRALRQGSPVPGAQQMRAEVDTLFKRMAAAASNAGLDKSYDRIRLALIAFVDFMISNSTMPSAPEWHRIAHELSPPEFALEEKFFHPLLDETLASTDPEAIDQLEVFFTCLGLGFTGYYHDDPAKIQEYLGKLSVRLRDRLEGDDAKYCPDAYRHTDERVLEAPTRERMMMFSVGVAVLLGAVFVISGIVYVSQTKQVDNSIKKVLHNVSILTM